MILGMSIPAFTLLHVIITVVAIGIGLIVVGGMFASHRLPATSALFLTTTILTSVTGFVFPIHGFTPALGVGIVSCVILAIALFAYYREHLKGAWRWIYVVTAIAALYVNVFVLIVQCFVKVAALNTLAPTQSEPHSGLRRPRCWRSLPWTELQLRSNSGRSPLLRGERSCEEIPSRPRIRKHRPPKSSVRPVLIF